jgi:two-component system sensor histidine kinase HydH
MNDTWRARVAGRTQELFDEQITANYRRTSRMFAVLMIAQWLFAILIAVVWSPYGWAGKVHTIHIHVYLAVFLGGAISSLPVALALLRPTSTVTRHVIAIAQMLWSALLIHLTGGRIETHFHVFGSLAFLAFYRDWRVLIPATLVVAADHLLRGVYWPESVYGSLNAEWWRFLEHAFWVAFEDIVLVLACLRGVEEARSLAERHAEVEALSESEKEKAIVLEIALEELKSSQESLTRVEKLAAVGQLAASVGHELRNPLTAVLNAHTYISRRITKDDSPLANDARIKEFSELVFRELGVCAKIITDLLDFARARPPNLRPCPLGPLVDESISLVVSKPDVKIVNEVPPDMPVPRLDRDQFRQMVINLIQNAVEAMPPDHAGVITIGAAGGGETPWTITVSDNGVGIPEEIRAKIFQPLFTTKTKGTGLGLAVVFGVVERHKAKIAVRSEPGGGAHFIIELPQTPAAA